MNEDSFDTHFAALRDRFSMRLSGYQERLNRARASFVHNADPDAILELKRISHELAGAAGVFGFPEIGDAALTLERAAEAVLQAGHDRTAIIAPLRQLLREVELSL
jgi:HPt (histidine-containing phosphotransfer) domain-containing protein